jgi:pilus assembly protein CpaE
MARIVTLARRSYDFVVVDSFPLVDRIMMAVLDLSDRVYVVVEAMVPTVLGGVKLCQLLDSLGIPRDRQRVVLNRYARFAGNLRPADVAERLGRDIDYVVPFAKKQLAATNLGRPLILQVGRWFSSFGKVMHQMVDDIAVMRDQKKA